MPKLQDHGVVLRVRPYREADSLVRIFCLREGLVDAVARGARRPKSRLLAAVQPLAYAYFHLYRGRSGLDTVELAELESGHPRLAHDLERMAWGYALAGMVEDLFSLHDPAPDAFAVLVGALRALDAGGEAAAVGLHAGFRLLAAAGFGPDLHRCGQCQGPLAPPAGFDRWEGVFLCARCHQGLWDRQDPVSPGLLATLSRWEALGPERMGSVGAEGRVRREALAVLRQSLLVHSGRLPRAFGFLDQVVGAGERPRSGHHTRRDESGA
ncbi:MAG: DNA repair protein RecO [Firmicutes bacterium]|nr:DNA repair protein RecO [Alicyclobacillaceae bacterium]MCL6496930.1 DNA repair protein RecO [Bacillota bacterium]